MLVDPPLWEPFGVARSVYADLFGIDVAQAEERLHHHADRGAFTIGQRDEEFAVCAFELGAMLELELPQADIARLTQTVGLTEIGETLSAPPHRLLTAWRLLDLSRRYEGGLIAERTAVRPAKLRKDLDAAYKAARKLEIQLRKLSDAGHSRIERAERTSALDFYARTQDAWDYHPVSRSSLRQVQVLIDRLHHASNLIPDDQGGHSSRRTDRGCTARGQLVAELGWIMWRYGLPVTGEAGGVLYRTVRAIDGELAGGETDEDQFLRSTRRAARLINLIGESQLMIAAQRVDDPIQMGEGSPLSRLLALQNRLQVALFRL